ncbi:hypothetical protein PY092_04480 [Muricauda sp. 334s03]|uniref:Uncharacterized protein n=1 Tax=Flagellimonas yonaguniensis TaxID=3031325 RepID=A0ABT5XW37_9FLAO|nr:hypothetical protein [[Muricauda] yonaguniensis]MDF0715396.1 hypothetical protein [[Muricauda] yonaguniensis]
MILTIVILLVVLLALGLLFVPIQIYVDTATNKYFAGLKGLAKASFEPDEKEFLRVRLKVLFYEHCFYPLTKSSKPKPSKKKKTKPRRKIKLRKMVRLLKSFEVKRFALDMDTGDYVANAKMYPIFVLLNQYVASFHINFENRNRLVMDIRNRPYRILKSFINH